MKAVYKNPKELATKVMDLVDSYRDGLITYEKFEATMIILIENNEDRIYKNGFMPTKLVSVIGEDRKELIDEVASKLNK
ncbi:MAG: TIGR04540 family protein [Bacillota bacterium]|nr:TIGR04540 family protein [Bacillota bacterium]